ncbi:MAG: HpsJ-like protein, cyanoexosortase C-associated [Thainema sp.]
MATLSTRSAGTFYSAKSLCRLVGFTCIAGFLVDLTAIAIPVQLGNIQWRVGFLQQLSDRSIILLFGLALLMYSIVEMRNIRRQLALLCLALGVMFIFSCVLVVRDNTKMRDMTITQINDQAASIQTQIDETRNSPNPDSRITPENIEQASVLLKEQVATLTENAETGLLKTSLASIGNLILVGMALLGIGRYGLRPPKS